MTDTEVYKTIGDRATELVKDKKARAKMLEVEKADGKEAAIKWLYMAAIASLII